MDKYQNFAALAAVEVRGKDYRVRSRRRRGPWSLLAPHGGGIEPGTSEIAKAVAGGIHSFCAFEGIKRRGNGDLHITSARFDEPRTLSIAAATAKALTVHGESSARAVVFIGGRDRAAQNRLRASLQRFGFRVETHPNPNLNGTAAVNICNRCRTRAGVQIELSNGLRRSCFRSLSSAGRKVPTQRFADLVAALQEGIGNEEV